LPAALDGVGLATAIKSPASVASIANTGTSFLGTANLLHLAAAWQVC
jgi:hypothetical protein